MPFAARFGRTGAYVNKLALVVIGVLAAVTGAANASLIPVLGGQAVNDTDLNIMWVANADLAASNTFGVAGAGAGMDWDTAQAWVAGMNGALYLGFSDWRLPITPQPDASCAIQNSNFPGFPTQGAGVNCNGSELAHLFYAELGGTAGNPLLGGQGPFTGIQPGYWSGTEFAPDTTRAWSLQFVQGFQGFAFKNNEFSAWAVRAGNVAVDVPEPASLALLGLGLAGLGFNRRKKA